MTKRQVAIIDSGNIATDLMIKVLRLSDTVEMPSSAPIATPMASPEPLG